MAESLTPPSPSLPQEELPDAKRQKMSTSATSDDEEPQENGALIPWKPRYKRRKIAIFFAYCGVGYQGMQKNPGAKTIEGDLEEALYHAGAVPEEDRGCPKRVDWARSARTDKGVSAVGQVVSGKFYVDPPGFIERLNSHLASQIRVFGYKRVTPSFSAKKFCDKRRYVYLIPVFALDPLCHRDRESVLASVGSENELAKCVECSERGRKVFGVMGKRPFEPKTMTDTLRVGSGISSDTESTLTADVGSGISSNTESAMTAEQTTLSCVVNSEATDDTHDVGSGISTNTESAATAEQTTLSCLETSEARDSTRDGDSGISSNSESALTGEKTTQSCLETSVARISENRDLENDVHSELEKPFEIPTEVPENQKEDNLAQENGSIPEKRSEFRYTDDIKERFNRILKYYQGTHNFHNFTTRTKAEDPSAKRYIISFNANSIVTIDGMDFVKCEVVGQSFMLHQIRKMIGLAVAVMRNFCPESLFETAFQQKVNINVPMAPEVGLYLDECFFSSYNQKWKHSHEELSMAAYSEEAEDFKMKYIYSHIASAEQKDGAVALWLHSLNRRNYPDLNPVSKSNNHDPGEPGNNDLPVQA